MDHVIGADQIPPIHQPYDPDAVVAFHAARLLILLEVCGDGATTRYIEGATKLAKLDFFARYPKFLELAHDYLGSLGDLEDRYAVPVGEEVEAPMIRYRFGPWDPRYRQYLAFLEARGLVRVGQGKRKNTKRVTLTAAGRKVARTIANDPAYSAVVVRLDAMASNLATWTGTELKDFIYRLLADEVASRPFGQVIE